eukprot:TRINITY_DN12634_c0_g1_i1.p1 TRINITY_DN12634_c0_g1~~TRINITY_DN12634_c0_g1_i1.p1  ORF type:complete len:114 (-),score=5.56 TRINITY_DN12634_c0_g1_i1:11-352(-)
MCIRDSIYSQNCKKIFLLSQMHMKLFGTRQRRFFKKVEHLNHKLYGLVQISFSSSENRSPFSPAPDQIVFIPGERIIIIVIAKFPMYSALIPCLLYTSPSPRDGLLSRMPSSA